MSITLYYDDNNSPATCARSIEINKTTKKNWWVGTAERGGGVKLNNSCALLISTRVEEANTKGLEFAIEYDRIGILLTVNYIPRLGLYYIIICLYQYTKYVSI